MGINIHGVIEVRGAYPNSTEWVRFATLDVVYSRVNFLYSELFGLYHSEPEALFANRGLPKDATKEARIEHVVTATEEISGETHHDSWFTWDEMQASGWRDKSDLGVDTIGYGGTADRNWLAVFAVCDTLAEFYGAQNVRFVVWFEKARAR